MTLGWELVVGAVGLLLSLVFFYQSRRDRRKGEEARALLGRAYDVIEGLREDRARLGLPLETEDERMASAAAELAARGVSNR